MKKHTLPILCTAALFALTACAPAAETAATEITPEVTEATAESAPEPTADPAGKLYTYEENMGYADNALYEAQACFTENAELAGTNVYVTDFTTGQAALLCHDDRLLTMYPVVTDNTLYFEAYDDQRNPLLLAVPRSGGEAQVIDHDASVWSAAVYSDRYLYFLSCSHAPYSRSQGLRLDLQTGESEPWDLPAETTGIHGIADGGIITSRIVSDYPVPLPSDSEMADAILQNSVREFDLTDIATGQVIREIAAFRYTGEPDSDGSTRYSYLGRSGSDFYFLGEHAMTDPHNPEYRRSVLCVHSDGTQEDLGFTNLDPVNALCQKDEVRWFAAFNKDGLTYTIYDLQGNEIGQSAAPADASVYCPLRFLDDGRLVLLIGYDLAHDYRTQYAAIDADAFLSGGTEYTEIPFTAP